MTSNEAFFQRPFGAVRADLLGKTVHCGDRSFVIRNADTFGTNEGVYAPVAKMPPGDVYIAPFMGNGLVLIATFNDAGIPGSCVRLTEIELLPQNGASGRPERVKGAGKVAKTLNLAPKSWGVISFDGNNLKLTMCKIPAAWA